MADHKDQRMIDPLEDMTDQSVEEDSKKQKLNEQQRRAFYAVLLAFRAETLSSGNKRTQIIEKLMSEWSIAQETLVSFEDNIQKNLVAHQERVDSELQAKKPTLCSSWGRVNPEALVGRRVCVRMPGEDEFEVLVIKEFSAKDGTHRLATVDPNVMWLNEALSWIDVRKVPDEDIRWKNGEKPDFQTPPGSGAGQ
ncbi:BnaA04g27580D [Brassica napus]|uniref:BnaA04g27580D protein n=1 Tax=Brassica napus TaxID=3708 RepID=A0A078J5P4_BRANA|nr:BnaA04g27580D [Brassica napus]